MKEHELAAIAKMVRQIVAAELSLAEHGNSQKTEHSISEAIADCLWICDIDE